MIATIFFDGDDNIIKDNNNNTAIIGVSHDISDLAAINGAATAKFQ